MSSGLPNFAFSHSTQMARQRIEARVNLPRLFAAIDADPGIVGAGVVYIDQDFNVVVLREFQPICSIRPKKLLLREAPRYTSPAQYVSQVTNNPRESRVVAESIGMGLSCAGAIIGWAVMLTGAAAVPFSAGTSTVVAVAGYAAATASTAQCINGGMRVYNEVQAPERNDALDEQGWYQAASASLDVISLAGAGAATLTTVRLLKVQKAATGRSYNELLRSMNRVERKRLTAELLKAQNPQISARMLKYAQRAGELPTRLSNTQIRQATLHQIKDSLGALLTVTGSAQAGVLNGLAVGLYEELQ